LISRLRPGRDGDAPGLITLLTACWLEYPGCVVDVDGELPELHALATYFADAGGTLFVSELDGRIVGSVGTRPLADGAWELCKMYVDAGQRGSGLAQALLAAAEAHAVAGGATAMKLWSDTRFTRAHRFYENNSYVRSGPIKVWTDLSNSLEFAYAKPLAGVVVQRLDAAAAESAIPRLSVVLRDCVDAGASVSFLPPMAMERARGFWKGVASGVAMGTRILLGAWVDGVLVGTVMLNLDMPQNQGHRADLQKLLVHPAIRRRGAARVLMQRIETEALAAGRTLLVLDTEADSNAEPLYRSAGWTEAGRIPRFALMPDGSLSATILFWKELA
jgi:GNAT superfamily N-acetyltransferase